MFTHLKQITDFSEVNVRALLAKRGCSLARETIDFEPKWTVRSPTGLCEIVDTLREAYFAGSHLGKYEERS